MSTTADDSPAAGTEHSGPAGPLQLPADVGPAGPAHAPRRAGRVAQARRAALREPERAVAADAAGGGDPDRLDRASPARSCTTGRSTSPTARRARDDVPRGHRPRGVERRQRAGDVVLHDQRRGRVADQAPARARGARAVHARSRRAGRTAPRTTGSRSPTRSSARSTTGASSSRASGRTTWAGTASTPTRRAPPASCRWSTTRASTSTCC